MKTLSFRGQKKSVQNTTPKTRYRGFLFSLFLLSSFLLPSKSDAYYNLGAFWQNLGCTGTASYVQNVAPGYVQATSNSATLTENTGDLLVIGTYWNNNAATVTVTDSIGNVIQKVPQQGTHANQVQIWYEQNIKGGSNTVTVTQSTGTMPLGIFLVEYSGIRPDMALEASIGQNAPSASNLESTGTVTTTCPDLVVGLFNDSTGSGTMTPGGGWVGRAWDTGFYTMIEDNLPLGSVSGGQVNAMANLPLLVNATYSDAFWAATEVAFKPAPITYATPALVQTAKNYVPTTSSINIPVSAIGSGNLLVIGVSNDSGATVTNIIDNGTSSNSYVSANETSTAAGSSNEIWYAKNSFAGATSVTIHLSGTENANVWFAEFSGMDLSNPLDTGGVLNSQPSGSLVSAPQVNTVVPNEVIFSQMTAGAPNTGIHSGNPFTALTTQNGKDSAYSIASSLGSYGAKWDLTSSALWMASTASFRAALTNAPRSPATQFAFTTTPTLTTWACSPMTVQSQTGSGQAADVVTSTTVNLSSTAGVTFYSDPFCQNSVTSVSIGGGTASQNFSVIFSAAGSYTLTGSGSLTSATQNDTIATDPYTWTGGAGCAGTTWAQGTCWKGGAAPGATNVAHFDSTCTVSCSPALTANISVGGIWMHWGYAHTITQNAFTITLAGVGGFVEEAGTFAGGSAAITDNGNFILNGGTFTSTSGTMAIRYNLVVAGSPTFSANGGTITFTASYGNGGCPNAGSGSEDWLLTPGAIAFNNVTFNNGNTCNGFITGIVTINGNVIVNSGSTGSALNGGTLKILGNLTVQGGTGGNTGIIFSGGNAQTYTYTSGTYLGGTTVNKTLGSTLTLQNDLTLVSILTLTSGTLNMNGHNIIAPAAVTLNLNGTLTAGSGTLTCTAGWINNGGTFTAGTSTVIFTSGANHALTGSTAFYNFTMDTSATSAAKTLTFSSGGTTTVSNILTLKGNATHDLLLRSSTPGTQWNLVPPASVTPLGGNLDVQDSNSSAAIHSGASSIDSGNNTNWSFP